MNRRRLAVLSMVLLGAFLPDANAAEPAAAAQAGAGWAVPTLGGAQFWADDLFFHDWRIQHNVVTGHYRLLDGNNRRHASGSFQTCHDRLKQIRQENNLPPMKGKAVIVLHGLFRTRSSMDKLCAYLKKQGDYTVFNVGYPSTRSDVASHARTLARIIDNLDGIEEINFVAHSMGNIVIRHYMADQMKQAGRRIDPRIKRFVMLAPPNHGSLIALTMAENNALQVVTGDAVRQLGMDWAKLEGELITPPCEFGVIAGGKQDGKGFNPLLPGDNDGTVTVESTRLIGARDFTVLPVLHSFMMNDPRTMRFTARFLKEGYFISAKQRQPIAEQREPVSEQREPTGGQR